MSRAKTNFGGRLVKRREPTFLTLAKWLLPFVALLLGVFGVLQPTFFWYGAASFYLGMIVLCASLWFEPEWPQWAKITASVFILGITGFFSFHFFIAPAPLNFSAIENDVEYQAGTTMAGILWKSPYTKLDLLIVNPTDDNYQGIDLMVRPDYPVAGIGQASDFGDVSFQDFHGAMMEGSFQEGTIKKMEAALSMPLRLLATDAGYKVHCGTIPPKRSLEIVMALADVKEAAPYDPQAIANAVNKGVTPNDIATEMHFGEPGKKGDSTWFGFSDDALTFGDRPHPKNITITGSYIANNRKRKVDQVVTPWPIGASGNAPR